MCDAFQPFGVAGILFALYAATAALGAVFHATAVVSLMFPVCKKAADLNDLPIHATLAILMIGAGAQMLTPFSYQTNLMAFGSGSYSVRDFWNMGYASK